MIALLISCSLLAGAQDLTPKKDTVAVPVYISEKTDTVQVQTLLFKGAAGQVLYTSPGYVIVKTQVGTTDGKNYQPLSQPKVIGAMDSRRRPVSPIIQ